ncbi:hypothetical protein BDB00DRAFT_473171 [Zychaea mexicana]|uniref:uncharacterized protein n=1 Tax=Zychaea mexicana TaxID=64656 RepID=UPI0022FDB2E2|nr:uncharacterized protein BDB00DRAFT_473171 [Zychaea mexicana]KAI9491804.1 hypothetical protein BDB00DRAFT_473171 [Zychaea mexicana]
MHGVHPFSLRPPPHLMRSRRQSRTAQQNGAVTLEGVRAAANQQEQQPSLSSDIPETRSQASSKNSGTSAVSPRFMALRKLSESGFMSSYAKPPPPPPPPPTATHSSSENSSIAPDTTDLNYALHEQRLLDRIDEMIETKLKSNISEILWRATESHRDARRFWEDQRRDMLELGASILHKLSMNQEQQRQQQQAVRPQRRRQRQRRYHPDGTIMSPEDQEEEEEDDDDDLIFEEEELESLRKLRIDLENEVSGYQLKEIAQQTELQSIRQRNAELEKQVEMHRQRNSELETRLAATATTTTSSVVTQDRPCAPTIEKSVTAAGAGESSTTTTTPDLSATTSVVSRDVQTDNNRIISTATMDWADVVAEDEWAKKYTELESKYQVANSKIAELKKQLRRQSSSTTATAAALVKQPRPASSMATVRPPSRTTTASPLPAATTATATATANNNNYSSKHRKHKSMTVVAPPSNNTKERKASHRQSYFMNEDGHLTFTTEINGRLSQYTVKLPGKEDTSSSASSKLNPLAQPWKTPTTH